MVGTDGSSFWWPCLVLTTATLVGFFCFRRAYLIYAALFFWGIAWSGQRHLLPDDSLAFLPKSDRQEIEHIEGMVEHETDEISVRRIFLRGEWVKRSGKVKISPLTKFQQRMEYGELYEFSGKLVPIYDGFKNFSYRRYLNEKGVYWWLMPATSKVPRLLKTGEGCVMVAASMRVRRVMQRNFDRYLSPRESGFLAALVFGERKHFPSDLKEVFQNIGVSHILAISGMNMAVVGSLVFLLVKYTFVPRRWQYVLAVMILFGYALVSGWSVSVVRACIMSSIIFLSFAVESDSDGLNSLGLAGLMLLILDPRALYDLGFQLSFAAVAGILIGAPWFQKMLRPLPELLRVPLAVSLSAWLTTSAITVVRFHSVSPIAIVANLPIVPLADALMALGLILALGGDWLGSMAPAFAACLKVLMSALIGCALWFNSCPFGYWRF